MTRPRNSPIGGLIYLIHCLTTDYYKIGVCRQIYTPTGREQNVQARIETLQTGCPLELVYVCLAEYPSYANQHERAIHEKYWKRRVHEEWFKFAEDEVAGVIEEINNTKRIF